MKTPDESTINELGKFIQAHSLIVQIDCNQHPLVEAWTYLGKMIGLVPHTEIIDIPNISTERQYAAKCKLLDVETGITYGGATAICGFQEKDGDKDKSEWPDNNLISMAQTRAVSKAFRLSFGWVMLDLGYNPTSAEEMEDFKSPKRTYKAPDTSTPKPGDGSKTATSQKKEGASKEEKASVGDRVRYRTELYRYIGNAVFTNEERAKLTKQVESFTTLTQYKDAVISIQKTIADRSKKSN